MSGNDTVLMIMDGQIGDVDAAVCGFCKHGEEVCFICGQLHHERTTNSMIAAHQKCMQYSSGLEQYKFDHFGGFHIDNVEKEIKRGRQLKCSLCRLGGATCGCAIRSCKKTFHFHCVSKSDQAVNKRFRVDLRNQSVILYRVYCSVTHKEEDKRKITAGEIDVLPNDSDSSNKDEPARKKKSPKKSKKSNAPNCPAYIQSQDSQDDDNYSIEIETTVEDEGVPEILHEDAAFSFNTSRMDATAESINKNGHADSIHDGFNSDESESILNDKLCRMPSRIAKMNMLTDSPIKQASNKSTSDEAVDLGNTLMNKGRKESPKKVDDSPLTKMESISSVKRSSSRLSSQTLTQESPAADNIEDLKRDLALQSGTPRKQASNKSTSDEAVDLGNTLMNKGRKESPKKVDDSPLTKMESISSVKRSSSRLSSQTLTQESPAADNIEDLKRDLALQSGTPRKQASNKSTSDEAVDLSNTLMNKGRKESPKRVDDSPLTKMKSISSVKRSSSRLSSQTLTQESPAADNIEDLNKDLALQSGTPRKQASNKSTSDEAVDLGNTLMNKGRKESPKKVDDSPFTKMKSISSVKRSSSRLTSQTLTQESPAADNIEDLNRDVALQSGTDASPVIITDDSDTTDQSCASGLTGEIDVLPNDSDSSNKDEPARENTSPKKTVRKDRRDGRRSMARLKELTTQCSLEAPSSGSRNKRKIKEEDLASKQTTPVKSAKQQKTGKVSATATISDTTTPVKVNTVAVDGHNKQSKPSSQLTTGSRNNSPSKVSEIVSLTTATISDTTTPVKVNTVAVDGHNKQSKPSSQLTTGSRNNSPTGEVNVLPNDSDSSNKDEPARENTSPKKTVRRDRRNGRKLTARFKELVQYSLEVPRSGSRNKRKRNEEDLASEQTTPVKSAKQQKTGKVSATATISDTSTPVKVNTVAVDKHNKQSKPSSQLTTGSRNNSPSKVSEIVSLTTATISDTTTPVKVNTVAVDGHNKQSKPSPQLTTGSRNNSPSKVSEIVSLTTATISDNTTPVKVNTVAVDGHNKQSKPSPQLTTGSRNNSPNSRSVSTEDSEDVVELNDILPASSANDQGSLSSASSEEQKLRLQSLKLDILEREKKIKLLDLKIGYWQKKREQEDL